MRLPGDRERRRRLPGRGVRLVDVLDAAGVGEDARHVEFVAADVSHIATPAQRFGGSIPLSKATGGAVLLAWAMNGVDLPTVHGAPVRVIVPGYVGARSVKWLEEINVRRDPSDNYFQTTAYRLLPPEADPDRAGHGEGLSLGPIAVNSDILAPEDGDSVHAGPTVVTGYALAGDDRGIARVDVSVDGGRRWTQAALGEQSGPWAWRLWHATVEVPPGVGGDYRTRVGHRGSCAARTRGSVVESEGLRQQRLAQDPGYCPFAIAVARVDARQLTGESGLRRAIGQYPHHFRDSGAAGGADAVEQWPQRAGPSLHL